MQSADLCISSLRQQSFHFFWGIFFLEKNVAKFYRKKLIDMVDVIFMALWRRVWGHINLSPVHPFIRSDIDTWFVRLHCIPSYSFGATALIFCRMFINIMEVCMSTRFWFSSNILKMTGSWTFVRLDIDTWFVRLSPPTVLELQLNIL